MSDKSPRWTVKLTFKPALGIGDVAKVVEYIDEHDYVANFGDDGLQWHELPVAKRIGWGYWGHGRMVDAFQDKFNRMCNGEELHKIEWSDSFKGNWQSEWLYRGQDVGKLVRVLKKLECVANGTITGTHFAVEGGSTLFVVDNTFRAPVITTLPGHRIFEDSWESEPEPDDEETDPPIKKAKT